MEQSQKAPLSQILRFELAGEQYAFDVLKTREVLTIVKVTPLPNASSYLSGVVNLRGSVIPVVDLRKKFGLEAAEQTADTAIVIMEIQNGDEALVVGAIVDAVRGVVSVEQKNIEAPPKFGMRLKSALVELIAKFDSEFIIILNVDKVFQDDELSEILAQPDMKTDAQHSEAS